ncbi:MAG: aminotransferase class I/II-fold pyridoxal phosphate-dependent enzyme, partial [Thermoleophilaceae bacterium]|nr:aminotransferase class I/II-fold pyridoxal phosphate-dependent enzyme [Thermoleophilaceae bacterium]
MGLLDYYRQFEDMDQEEVNKGLRERRAREKALALEQVPVLDLSSTEWPDFPNSEIVNASIATARGKVNGYPDRHAGELRGMIAKRHGVDPQQVAVGNGAAEMLQAAAYALLGGSGELVTPWPSYPLYPLMASRAGGKPVAVDSADPEDILAAVTEQTRIVMICNPNDPTGTYVPSEHLAGLVAQLPDHVHVLVDEAYVQFQFAEDEDACLRLVDSFPQLLVFRTFSKVYGLSGLRCGYAVANPAAASLLERIAPVLGVNALTQSAALQALKIGDPEVIRRSALVAEQRRRVESALHDLPFDAPPTQANFVWLRAPEMTGAEIASRLEEEKVLVAPGGPLGAEDHVRASIRGPAATSRLLEALEKVASPRGDAAAA